MHNHKKTMRSPAISKRAKRRPNNKQQDNKGIKSIWIVNKTFLFNEQCFSEWLNNFCTINVNGKEYELMYNESNIDSCLLGQGGNGFVFKYICNEEKFAIKFFTNKDKRDEESKKIKNVNNLFKGKKSPNFRVTKFIDQGEISLNLLEYKYNLFFIIMDLADGTIKNLMCAHFKENNADLETSDLLNQIKHLSETIQVLHSANYAHRDIKPENILLKGNLPVLADFGLTSDCNSEIIRQKGPKYWPNPEFIQACDLELQTIDLKSDIFNLGCLFFYFFTKKYPIGLLNIENELQSVTDSIREVIIKMLKYNKEERLDDISEVIKIFENKISGNSVQYSVSTLDNS